MVMILIMFWDSNNIILFRSFQYKAMMCMTSVAQLANSSCYSKRYPGLSVKEEGLLNIPTPISLFRLRFFNKNCTDVSTIITSNL